MTTNTTMTLLNLLNDEVSKAKAINPLVSITGVLREFFVREGIQITELELERLAAKIRELRPITSRGGRIIIRRNIV